MRKEDTMKKIFIALVMLCGFLISNNYYVKALDCDGYEIKLKQTEIDVYLNGDIPNYYNYFTVVDRCGNKVNYDKQAIQIHDYQVDLNRVGRYKVVISLLIGDFHDVKEIYVNVKEDLTPPVLTYAYTKYYFKKGTNLKDELFLNGNMKAYDEFDGDLTDRIKVDYHQIDTNHVGEYEVTFSVTDNNNNETRKKLKVYIVDKLPELIMNLNDLTLEVHSPLPDFFKDLIIYEEEGVRASITIDHRHLRNHELGIYEVKYTAELFNIIETKYQRVIVVDTTSPEIIGVKEIKIKAGTKLNLYEYFEIKDNYDVAINVIFKGDYDTKKSGTYKLTCVAQDNSGNTSEYPFLLIVEKNKANTWLWVISIISSLGLLSGGIYYLYKERKNGLSK